MANIDSPVVISGHTCSFPGVFDGTFSVILGESYVFKDVNDESLGMEVVDSPGLNSIAVADGETVYVYVERTGTNQGTIKTSNTASILSYNHLFLHAVNREGNKFNQLSLLEMSKNYSVNNIRKDAFVNGFELGGGGVLTVNASKQVKYTEATFFLFNQLKTVPQLEYASSFETIKRDGLGGWTRVNETIIQHNKFDNGSGTLATLSNNNKRAVFWFNVVFDDLVGSHLSMLYGQAEYDTFAEAQSSVYPTTRPGELLPFSVGSLVYRVITKATGEVEEIRDYKSLDGTSIVSPAQTINALNDLDDVDLSTEQTGEVLQKDSGGLWVNRFLSFLRADFVTGGSLQKNTGSNMFSWDDTQGTFEETINFN